MPEARATVGSIDSSQPDIEVDLERVETEVGEQALN